MTIVLLRHASAGDRLDWGGDDMLRPLDRRGRAQARRCATRCSAAASRSCCRAPTCAARRPSPRSRRPSASRSSSTTGSPKAPAAPARVELLAERDGCVACTHGDIVEEMLGRTLKKGAAAVVRLEGNELRLIETLKAP